MGEASSSKGWRAFWRYWRSVVACGWKLTLKDWIAELITLAVFSVGIGISLPLYSYFAGSEAARGEIGPTLLSLMGGALGGVLIFFFNLLRAPVHLAAKKAEEIRDLEAQIRQISAERHSLAEKLEGRRVAKDQLINVIYQLEQGQELLNTSHDTYAEGAQGWIDAYNTWTTNARSAWAEIEESFGVRFKVIVDRHENEARQRRVGRISDSRFALAKILEDYDRMISEVSSNPQAWAT